MFEKWQSIPRLNKQVIVTEKIDGTNAQLHVLPFEEATTNLISMGLNASYILGRQREGEDRGLALLAGSRGRYLCVENDNFLFAQWVSDNASELFKLGCGRHYGEWWGLGIQRGYGLTERKLSMFNPKWVDQGPECVDTTPVLGVLNGFNDHLLIDTIMYDLQHKGSTAAPGFMDPEGIVVFHTAGNHMYKQTFDYDEGKWSKE